MPPIRARINRYLAKYVDSRVVLAMDLFLSLLSSICIFLLLNYLTNNSYRGQFFWIWIGASFIGTVIAIFVLRSYKNIIRHLGIRDLAGFIYDVCIKGVVMVMAIWYYTGIHRGSTLAVAVDVILTFVVVVGVRLVMILAYDTFRSKAKELRVRQRVLIYGTSDKSVAAYARFLNSPHYSIVGFIAEEYRTGTMRLQDLPVFNYRDAESMQALLDRCSIGGVLFVSEADAKREMERLLTICAENGVKPLIVPSVEEVVGGKVMNKHIRDVKIENLLGRDEIQISMNDIIANFHNKVVMVTGAAGSIGSELCRQLAEIGVRKLVIFDNAETPLHYLRLELEERFPKLVFVPVIGDVRYMERLDFAFRKYQPQVVFHAAAYKHVPLMEENPCEAVMVNVGGTRLVADKCIEYGVEKMVMISTDKAVNPTNIMGCSKRLAEIYVQSLGLALENGTREGSTRFVTTRFGNVLGSNGSVIPRFREQIEKGGPVTVTHPDITRFFMTIPEACRLVMEAATMSTGNQIYVFDMGESVRIDALAKRMIKLAGLKLDEDIKIEYTGLRPGEKLYEEVLSNSENTLPTTHDRIRIAKVREYEYDSMAPVTKELVRLAKDVNIPDMVVLMKKTVPEFKSKNSPFEEYDIQA